MTLTVLIIYDIRTKTPHNIICIGWANPISPNSSTLKLPSYLTTLKYGFLILCAFDMTIHDSLKSLQYNALK
jgi:hypothetical protein